MSATAGPAWGGGCCERCGGFPRGVGLPHETGSLVRVWECCASGTHTKKCPSNKAFLHFVRVCELIPRSSESGRDSSQRELSRKDGMRGGGGVFTRTLTQHCKCACAAAISLCV